MIEHYISHLRNFSFMSGVERDKERLKSTNEIFTPTWLVQQILNDMPQEIFNENDIFLDPTCGDGQFLSEVLIRKLENDIDFETALSTIYGVDIMQDNIDICKQRLLCGHTELQYIVDKNIVCTDATEYDFNFGETIVFGNDLFEIE